MQRLAPLQRVVLSVTAVLATLLLIYVLRGVLTPVFLAFLIAYMLDPLVDRIETFRVPRAAAILVLLAVSFVALLVIGLLVLPAVARDTAELVRELPQAARRLLELVGPRLAELGIVLPSTGEEALARIEGQLGDLAPSALAPLRAAVTTVLGSTALALSGLAAAIMVPILAFYLLHDFDVIVAAARDLLPQGVRPRIVAMTREVDGVLGQFVRGQVTVMLILAILYAGAYSLAGVRLAVPIGLVAGLLSFIPYVGGAVALGLALLMVVLHFDGWGQVAAVVGAYAVIQLLEGFVITPRIVGDKLGLSPLWVLFALMVGGELFGFLGVMLALPASAVIKVFVVHGLARYRSSALFQGPREPPLAAAPAATAGRLRLRTLPVRHRRRARR